MHSLVRMLVHGWEAILPFRTDIVRYLSS